MGKTRVLEGDRITRGARVSFGCAACLFDASRTRLLLTRRSDNGQWCLPSGKLEAGESAAEACERETLEETGLVVKVKQLVGVYSNPHLLVEYPDGNRIQIVSLLFEVEQVGGSLGLSDETSGYDYFTREQAAQLDLIQTHAQRIWDAFDFSGGQPFIR